MKCSFCEYEWESRKPDPKACPRCKKRFDYPIKKGQLSKDPLSNARKIERGFERTIYVMSVITPMLEDEGIGCVIVGGSAVEFYTRDWYATGDIDLAVSRPKKKAIDRVMELLYFKKAGRMWVREDLNLYIEMPGDLRDIDMERVTRVETEAGHTFIIGMEDIILDRILAAEHWKSESDREQAIRIASAYYEKIDWKYVQSMSRKENAMKMFRTVKEEAINAKE